MVSHIKDYDFRYENNWSKGLKSTMKGRDVVNSELKQSSFKKTFLYKVSQEVIGSTS